MKPLETALALSVAVGAAPPALAFSDAAFAPQELGSLSSVASVEDASALAVNPAALAYRRGGDFFLSRSVNGQEQTNLFLTGGGLGSAWQQYRTQGRFLNAFTLGTGLDAFGGLSLGGSFGYLQFLDGLGGNSATFSASAMYRPNRHLAAGLSVNHLTQPPVGATTLPRFYRAGLAVRPWDNRLTVSLDGAWQEGDAPTAITPALGIQAELWRGMTLRGLGARNPLDGELRYSVGLGLGFGQAETGFISGASHGRVGGSDMAYFATSELASRRSLPLGVSRMAYMRLEGELLDLPVSPFDLRTEFYPGVLHLTRRIAQAKEDPKITGLALDLRGVRTGLGHLQELRAAVLDFKTSGKPAIAYVYDSGIGEYYLATAADKVFMHPAGSLDVKGVSASMPFFRGLLDKIGVQPQFVGIGKYKSAPEQFTNKQFSAPAREQTEALLDAQLAQLSGAIAEARRLSPAEVREAIAKGSFTPPLAKERRLIDEVAYPDEVPGVVEKGPARTYELKELQPDTWGHPEELAVVAIEGAIVRGESAGDFIDGTTAGSATITRALREVRNDDNVKAVVIRVDSPGGDAVASDEIGREIDLLRLAGKPVIVSMGNVAASGGYWVAANGTRVYAEPGTITGSIGVYTGSFAFGGLLNKLGVTTQTIKRGEHADMESGFRALSAEEVGMLRDQARYTYGQFLERVAEGRKLPVSRVDAIAQGRVWAGSKALEIKLIDRFGGLEEAIADARAEARLDPNHTVLSFYPKPGALWETLDDSTMDVKLQRTAETVRRYSRVNTWLLMPPQPEVK